MAVRKFLEWVNWAEKSHVKCWWHHPLGWGPRPNKEEKMSCPQACIFTLSSCGHNVNSFFMPLLSCRLYHDELHTQMVAQWTLALKNDIDNFWLCVSPLPLVPLAPHFLWSIHFSFFKTHATSHSSHETSPSFSGPHVSVSKHPLSSMRFNIQLSCVFFYHQCYICRYT